MSFSDSWERVSVGDCSGEDLANKPQPGEPKPQPGEPKPQPGETKPEPGEPKPQPGETNPTLVDSTPSVQLGKKEVNIERVFRYDFKQISHVSLWNSY